MRAPSLIACFASLRAFCPIHAQTTQGIITGRVIDSRSGDALPRARVLYRNPLSNESGLALTDSQGRYSLSSLTPGQYVIRAELADYQAREIQTLDLYVAARLEIDFSLRPLREALEPGDYNSALLPDESAILPVIGPDLEGGRSAPLEATAVKSAIRQPSLSYVVDPKQISEAPLSARNVYALMTTLPGVTAAQVTGRGLQISANGQRASSSNYLLDGVQNNDFLNTGPFSPTAPEAIQEYRVSTNNYSAEYGQTGGFIANAVTRAGSEAYHGVGYGYLDNQALDANTFQNNASGVEKNPFKQLYLGYSAGGPVIRNRLFFSSSFEHLRSRSRRNAASGAIFLPSRLRQCLGASSSPILDLYDRFPLIDPANAADQNPAGQPCLGYAVYTFGAPVAEDRSLALERIDYRSPGGTHRLMGRLAISRVTQPDFVYSPYRGLNEPLVRNSTGLALGYVRSLGPSMVNDARFSWNTARIDLTRPHPEIPILQNLGNPELSFLVPSAGYAIDFGMRGGQYEMADGLTIARGRHIITTGGGALFRRPQYLLSYLGQGLYNFNSNSSILDFAAGKALYFVVPLSQQELQMGNLTPLPPAGYDQYSNNQFSAYAQDNIKLTRNLAMNLGVRYESYGTLLDETTPHGFLQLGRGASIDQRLVNASPDLLFVKQPAYRPDRRNWAGRFGLSYSPWNGAALRAGFGIFYDRPFDNLLLDSRNDIATFYDSNGQAILPATQWSKLVDFQHSLAQLFDAGPQQLAVPFNARTPTQTTQLQSARSLDTRIAHTDPRELLWIDENLRIPYTGSWFASAQQQITGRLSAELSTSGALARKLIANDLVNRECSLGCSVSAPVNFGRLNASLPDILYRSNSGSSDYAALGLLARYRTNRALFQAAYTYSHSIDNQSDPLLSDVFNLAFTNLDTLGAAQSQGVFTRQFDSRADRARSDFDIRHNLVFYSIWDLPGFHRGGWLDGATRNWSFAQVASIRSGLPYTLFAANSAVHPANSGGVLVGVREDLAPGVSLSCVSAACSGLAGKQLINPAALITPAPGQIGALGRNALAGPGFWNIDLSLTRSFRLALLGESGRVQLGLSAFNAFNHSNLGFPGPSGFAQYGPSQNQTQFPAALPQFPSPRRIQLQLKVSF